MRFRVLGAVGAVGDDGTAVRIAAGRQRALLAVLVARRGRVVSRDVLIEALWPAGLPDNPLNALQHYVARLRSVFGVRVRTAGAGYVLDVDDRFVDADDFEAVAGQGRAALTAGEPERALTLLDEALGLWQGEPFAEFVDLEFVAAERVRLIEQREAAVDDRFEALLATGADDAAVAELAAAVARQPGRERRWGQLMRALYRTGRQAEALAAYQRARRHLSEELGLDPGRELQDLELRILKHDVTLLPPAPASAQPAPVTFPRPSRTSFIGRGEAMRCLDDLLARSRLVTVRGPSGVGKTRLVLEWVNRLTDATTAVVSVESIAGAPLLVPAICAAAGVPEDPTSDPLHRLVDQLGDRPVILVLDGCEVLLDAVAALVDRVLSNCPAVSFVVTSQTLLGLADEAQLALSGLPTATSPGGYSDGSQLLIERARLRLPGFAPTQVDLETIDAIVRAVDGLPLGIELAAARIASASPQEILRSLSRGRDLPATESAPLRRHSSLIAALDWTLSLLGGPERRTLDELAQLPGSFTADTATAVCSSGADEMTGHIGELVGRALVRADRRGTQTVYSIAPGTRRHVNHRGDATPGVIDHYARLAQQIDHGLKGPRQLEWLATADIERENLTFAFHSAMRSVPPAALAMAAALGGYWDWRGLIAEANHMLAAALQLDHDGLGDIAVRVWAGFFAWEAGDLARASTLMNAAVERAAAADDAGSSAAALGGRGLVARTAGPLDAARRDLRAGLELAAAAGDRWCESWICSALSACELDHNNDPAAAAYARRALDGFRRLGDRRGEAWALAARSAVLEQRGDDANARTAAADAVLLAHSITDARTVAAGIEILARIARRHGDFARAVELLACVDAMQLRRGVPGLPSKAASHDEWLIELDDALGHQQFSAAWHRGAGADVIDLAVQPSP